MIRTKEYYTSKGSVALHRSENLFVIRTKKGENAHSIIRNSFFKDEIPVCYLVDEYPEANVWVFKLEISNKINLDTFKLRIRKQQHAGLEYIGSVYRDKVSARYQLYTGNLFIRFLDSFSTHWCSQRLSELNLIEKLKLGFTPNSYFVEPVEEPDAKFLNFHDAFEWAAYLNGLSEVFSCQPELVVKRKNLKYSNQNAILDPDRDWIANKINLKEAWKSTKGLGVKICIIDDGIDPDHPGFAGAKIISSRDMLKEDNNVARHQFISEKHGTACASVAASGDYRALGVAPDAELIIVRCKGLGSVLEAEAIYWAVKQGADIISCSWGPSDGEIDDPSDDFPSHRLPEHTMLAFEYAAKQGRNGKGCPIFFAAGNGNEAVNLDSYASNENVMAIGAVNKQDRLSVYSDKGFPLFCVFPSSDLIKVNGGYETQYGVTVADRRGIEGYSDADYFSLFGGTSASAPGMAGVAALALSENPNLTVDQLRGLFISSCIKIGLPSDYDENGYSEKYGHGLVDALKVVKKSKIIEPTKNRKMESKGKKAVSLHIGINDVDQGYYANQVPPLSGCINDMDKMTELANTLGYETYQLPNKMATKAAITSNIITLGNSVEEGGILLITYAGHGAPFRDQNEVKDESDGYDESWVTYDGFMLDDEVYNCLAKISQRIRVVLVSDSCHSETMTRISPFGPRPRTLKSSAVHAILKRNGTSVGKMRKEVNGRQASTQVYVINLSACKADQFAYEQNNNGLFTLALISVFEQNGNTLNYRSFINEIRRRINNPSQIPNLSTSHNTSDGFMNQSPFTTDKIELPSSTAPITNPPFQDPLPEGGNDDRPIYLETESLLVETDTETAVHTTNLGARGSGAAKTLRIIDDSVDATEVMGHTDWDKAYNLMISNSDKEIESIEPDTTSHLYFLDGIDEKSRSAGGYLDTYPNAEEEGNQEPFIWHLDEAHSQLRMANEEVFPEAKLQKKSVSRQRLVKIAHIDTGFIPNHPSHPINLDPKHVNINGGRIRNGAIDKDALIAVAEQHGHGHATMSLLAGNWVSYEETNDNYQGFFGAIPYAQVLTIKISETVALLSGKNFAKAIDYAIDQKCDVVTMSMAGLPSKVMAKAINRAYEAGIVVVSAASNCFAKGFGRVLPNKTLYPARYDRVISAVGAAYNDKPYLVRYHEKGSRAEDGLYMQTCYGPDYVLPTSIAAYTPNITWFHKMEKGNGGRKSYYVKSGGGTSSATPQVAAAAALYLQKYHKQLDVYTGNNAWKKAEIIRQALFQSANKTTGYNFVYGNGILKAHNALASDFEPSKMIGKIVDPAKPAPEKRRLLGGFFHVFSSRSIGSQYQNDTLLQDKLEDMVATEVSQLIYKDPDLFRYAELLDLESDVFDLFSNRELVDDLLKSEHASDFLKRGIRYNREKPNGTLTVDTPPISNTHFPGDGGRGGFSITTTNMSYTLNNKKSFKENYEEHEVWVDSFELEIGQSRGYRNELPSNLEINLDEISKDLDSSLLVEKIYDGDVVFEWKIPGIRKTKDDESSRTAHSAYTKPPMYLFNALDFSLSGERGFLDPLKRMVIKIFKWKRKPKPSKNILDKLVSRLGDTKYGLRIFDLELDGDKSTVQGWQSMTSDDQKNIIQGIQSDKLPVLLLFPGLFSTIESGFDDFLEDAQVRKKLRAKHCRYVIGCNMPTVVHGIEENAQRIAKELNFLSKKPCNVLARSRGGVVARYLFEVVWTNTGNNKPLSNRPLDLHKLVMYGTPNEGTMLASTKNWRSMLNLVTNISRLTLGTVAPVVPKILTIVKALTIKLTELPGINDLEEESELLQHLNSIGFNQKNYFVFTSNFEPNRKFLKRLFDEFLVDRAIFKREPNDSVTPVAGAIFQGSGTSCISLKADQYHISDRTDHVSHFGYLHPKHPQIIEETLNML